MIPTNSIRYPLIAFITLLMIPALSAAAAPTDRDAAAPPVVDPVSAFPDDNAPDLGADRARTPDGEPGVFERAPFTPTAERQFEYDAIGGDDAYVTVANVGRDPTMDIASNGDIYAAWAIYYESTGYEIEVRRSTNGGEHFEHWGTIEDPGQYETFHTPQLKVIEGVVDAVYVMYQRHRSGNGGYHDICLVSSPLGASPVWSAETTVMDEPGVNFENPRFASDVLSWAPFYLYAVAEGNDGTGQDIWFARSTNQGSSFETPYQIASLLVTDRYYGSPDIDYGFNGNLHVTWYFYSTSGEFDGSLRYRHADNYAGNGIADWDYWVAMTSHDDGYEDRDPRIEASADTYDVVIGYSRDIDSAAKAFHDARVFVSHDSGANFDPPVSMPDGPYLIGDIGEQLYTGVWMMAGSGNGSTSLYTASESDLGDWSDPICFEDEFRPASSIDPVTLAFNPADGYRPAVVWIHFSTTSTTETMYFDADWLDDPGWANYEPGFPLDTEYLGNNITPPALVDLDGDDDLEIVYSSGNSIAAYHHDGTLVAGWPVDTGTGLAPGPVAVGDLNGDGHPLVVAGASDGTAYAYDHQGNLMPGWPSLINHLGDPVYVSIGALGGGYHRTVVCVSGNYLRYRNRRGVRPADATEWSFGGDIDFVAPAAIGDIDEDGVAEVVFARNTAVFAAEMTAGAYDFIVGTGHAASDAATLGDLDLDGDLEIFVPTEDGELHVLDHTGAVVSPFPWDSGTGEVLSSVALANIRSGLGPELIFTTQNEALHALFGDGLYLSSFPVALGSVHWARYNSPAVERFNDTTVSGVVVVMTHIVNAWTNNAVELPNWPAYGNWAIQPGPAAADIDLDGSVEVVYFDGYGWLHVIDVNSPPNDMASEAWPMYAHDPQRTGCSDCPEDLSTAVEPGEDGDRITRVSFAAPSPNPAAGSTRFSYAIPTRATVSLEVYDLRGRRVDTVLREEFGPGHKVLTWDGHGRDGAPLPSGVYFARLRVRGPGVKEELVREVTLLR